MTFLKIALISFLIIFLETSVCAQYNIGAYITNAKKDIAENKFADAIDKLNTCVNIDPDNCEAYFYRGFCKYSLADNLGAETDFTMTLTHITPFFYDAYYYRSIVRYGLGNYTGTIEDLNKVIKKQESNPQLYIERAFALLANNNYNAAINDCKKTLSLGVMSDNVYMCKAACEEALVDYENALLDYNKAIKIDPKAQNTYVRRGITKFKMGKFNDAIDDYNYAIKLDSASTFAYYNRAEAENKLNDLKKALNDYNIVIKFEPRNSYAYFNRAVLYADLQKYKPAIEDFNKVLILNPNNIKALFNRAKLKQNVKDYKGAISDYDKIIELYPYFTEAYYNRSQIKSTLNDFKGAKKDIETGNIMSDLLHSKSYAQLNSDSILLEKLSYLSADFNSSSEIKRDTININFKPIFFITENTGNKCKTNYFTILLDNFNRKFGQNLCLKNSLTENYDSIVMHSASQTEGATKKESLLILAIQKSNMQLFNEANDMLNKIISEDSLNAIAYFVRGVNTCRLIETMNNTATPYFITNPKQNIFKNERHEKCQSALSDFTKTLTLASGFAFAYYNRAYVKCLLDDFNGALYDYEQAFKKNSEFADAYYNYGYILYHLNMKQAACQNFSKAGELGLTEAFSFIKKYCGSFK